MLALHDGFAREMLAFYDERRVKKCGRCTMKLQGECLRFHHDCARESVALHVGVARGMWAWCHAFPMEMLACHYVLAMELLALYYAFT